MYLLIVFLPLLDSSVASFFGRFLGSEGGAIMTSPEFLFLLFAVLITLICVYRSRLHFSMKRK